MTSGRDEEARIEDDLLALVRAEHGYDPPDLDPEGVGTARYQERSAAMIAQVLASPRGGRPEASTRRRRRRAVRGAAGLLVAAGVAFGAVVWWPGADDPAPSGHDRTTPVALTPMVVTPPQGQGTAQVLTDLAARADRAARSVGPTRGKATPNGLVTAVTWAGRSPGRVAVRTTVASHSTTRVVLARSSAAVFTDGALDRSAVAALAQSPAATARPVRPAAALPSKATGRRLVADVLALAPDCGGEVGYCFALGMRTWATTEVIDPGAAQRILAALDGLSLEHAGSARDRLGRAVEVFTVNALERGEQVRLLFDRETGDYLGDEVTTERGAVVVSTTVIVEARHVDDAELPPWAQHTL